MTDIEPFFRHIARCNSAGLPIGRLPLFLRDEQVGWARPDLAGELTANGVRHEGGRLVLDDPAVLERLGRVLADAGLVRWRGEPFDVRARPDGPVLAQLDRGALPDLGIFAEGVHLNGLVETPKGLQLWVGRRASDKLLDPDKLDHLCAGGIGAGHDPRSTLLKEGAEECGLTPELVENAVPVAQITYAMTRAEGLRRDRLHCFDLVLPDSFVPVPHDGEVAYFMLMPIEEAFRLVRDTEEFKFNVNLVLIDLFLRRRLIDPDSEGGRRLRAGLNGPLDPGRQTPDRAQ